MENHATFAPEAAAAYAREQEAIRKARFRRSMIILGSIIAGLFVLMVGCGIAVGAAASGGSASTATPAASAAPATSAAPASPDLSSEVVAPAPAVPAPAPSTELPRTWISEGMWLVGPEVEAGTYRSDGPDPTDTIKMCYVHAKIGDHYAAQEVSDGGPVRVTVADGQTVEMSGCTPFTKVG